MSVDGVSRDGGENEDADLLPLSKIFSIRERAGGLPGRSSLGVTEKNFAQKKAASDGSGLSDSEGEMASRAPKAPTKGVNGSSGSFRTGDIVWAKAFPYTWWPGWIRDSKGSISLVSFFGAERTRRFHESRICGFEENYVRMSKMAGAKLADEIGCALEELSRRTDLGMRCSCRSLIGRTEEVKIGFKPAEMLDFVQSMAVCAWVGSTENIGAVRSATQVNAYRRHVRVALIDEVKDGFRPAEVLDFVQSVAVWVWIGEEKSAGVDREMAQVNAYRRFISVSPAWVYHRVTGEGGSLASEGSEGSHSEMSLDSEDEEKEDFDSSFENELEEQEVESSTFQEKVQGDGDFCLINRLHCNIPNSDEKFASPLDNRVEDIIDWSGSVGMDVGIKKKLEVKKEAVPLSNDTPIWRHEVSSGPTVSDLELSSSISKDTTKNLSADLHKSDDLSSILESKACFLRSRTETSSHLSVDFSQKPQLKPVSGVCRGKEGDTRHLHELLWHLHCLALDPFFLGARDLVSVHQRVLKYRTLVFQNTPELVSTIYISEDDQKDKAQEVFKRDQVMRIHNDTTETLSDDKVDGTCEDTNEVQLLSPIYCDGIKLQDSNNFSSEASCVPNVTDDAVKFQSSAEISLASNVLDRSDSAAGSDGVKFISRLTFPVNSDCEGVIQKRRFDQAIGSDNSFNLHKSRPPGSEGKLSSPLMLDNLNSTGDKTNFSAEFSVVSDVTEKTSFLDDAGYDVTKLQSDGNDRSVDSTKVSCSLALPMSLSSRGSFCRKRTSDRSVFSDLPKLHKICPHKAASNAIGRTRQPLANDRNSCFSKSLHMKFPKDFNLPSKEELAKKFSVFGPLDHSRTNVFFYTGAGQVAFLNPADAETAYKYMKRRNIFGKASMRFWLDEHENSRKGDQTDQTQSSLVLTGKQSAALDLKSCLKRPNMHGTNDPKTTCSVKFSIENQLSSLPATAVRKKMTFYPSVSPSTASRRLEPDISVQMLQLLESCNKLVHEIKSSLGLESYYSIFTHNYCQISSLDIE